MISLTMPDPSQRNGLHHAEHLGGRYHLVTHVAQDCNHASVDWQVVAMVMSALNCVMRISRWLQLDKYQRDFASGESTPLATG